MSKLLKFMPIEKQRLGKGCKCYEWPDKKPIHLILDADERLVYCEHCGNLIDPFVALELICHHFDVIDRDLKNAQQYIMRSWEIGRKYRPWKRALKNLEQKIGRKGENMPCCPHCKKAFRIEDIEMFRNPRGFIV